VRRPRIAFRGCLAILIGLATWLNELAQYATPDARRRMGEEMRGD